MPVGDDSTLAATSSARVASTTSATSLSAGTRIGNRYVVRGLLGEGGMGAVYRALDEELGEEVALKLVRDASGDHAALRDEVRLAQKVTHANVCRTYDLESADNHVFVKMECVAGVTLAAKLHRLGRMPIFDVIRIARAIVAGLGAAHDQGIAHRDLKPGNVMIGDDGRVVLMDFGLAHVVARGDASIAGTPGYMAPEQIAGRAVDARSDYYALGCVVYELLTGVRVFGTSEARDELFAKHLEAIPPDPRVLRRDTPRWLARATLELLEKDPAKRRAGVERLLAGTKRRRGRASIAAAICVAIALVVGAFALHTRPAWRPRTVNVLPAVVESSDGASLSPDGTQLAFNSNRERDSELRLYVESIATGETRAVTPPGESFDEPRWTRDGLALLSAIHTDRMVRVPLDGTPPIELGRGNNPDDCGDAIVFVQTDPDGTRLMLRTPDGVAHELAHAYADEVIERPRCDRSGQHVVFVRGATPASAFGDDVFVVDRTGTLIQLTTDRAAGAATFSENGRSVLFAARRIGKVQIYEIGVTGGAIQRVSHDDGPDSAPDVARDGSMVAITRMVEQFSIFAGTGDGVREMSRREPLYDLRVVTSDGGMLVGERAHGGGNEIVVVDVATGDERVIARGYVPFPSLDGRTIYYRSPDQPGELRATSIAGGTFATIARLPGRIVVGSDAPDGRHVELDREHRLESWRVDAARQIAADGVAGLLVPAPHGPWQYVVRPVAAGDYAIHLARASEQIASPELTATAATATWIDDAHLAYDDRDGIRVIDVATGEASTKISARDHAGPSSVIARDGAHWFDTRSVPRVTRHVLYGFANRPWRR